MAREIDRSTVAACPCGSGVNYSRCCGSLHRAAGVAPTAEALMRSRYSAYAKGLAPYLLRTWDPATRPDQLVLDPDRRWTGLEVVATSAGGELDDVGTVEFCAHHEHRGTAGVMHEVSAFRRLDGAWVYVDAVE